MLMDTEEKSGFVQLFGNYPMVRVIDFLITFREFDYPLTEIAENAGVAWSTLHSIFPSLVKLGIVRETRQIGRARLFKLNEDSSVVDELILLDNKIIHELAESMHSEKIAIPARTFKTNKTRA